MKKTETILIQQNKKIIISLLKKLKRDNIEQLITWLNENYFFTAPCSSKYHLNIQGGLAQHSLNVYSMFSAVLNLVKSFFNEENIIICGLLHDVCKVNHYLYNSATKSFKVEDSLPLGHGEKSVIVLQRLIELDDVEMLCIRWHMGAFDLSQYASRTYYDAVKKCPEIVALQSADYLATTFLEE